MGINTAYPEHAPHLAALLAENPSVADERAASYVCSRVPDWGKVALFGAGNNGRLVARRLLRQGVSPVAFIDDTPSKQGTMLEGIPIFSQRMAAEKYAHDLSVVVTILNPLHAYPDTEDRLRERWGWRCLPFLALAWQDRGKHGPLLHITVPSALLADAQRISEFDALLQDTRSKTELARQIAFRLTLDYTVLQSAMPDAYFPSDVPLTFPADLTFVDAGAFDGDSVLAFTKACRGSFKQVVAIEADPSNFVKLQSTLKGQPWSSKVIFHHAALSNSSVSSLYFNSTGDMAACLADSNTEGTAVPARLLSDVIPATRPVYIKFDIEGAEWDTLTASTEFLKRIKPELAVSVYHDPADLWRIPLWLNELEMGYKFWIRNHGTEGTDVVCYALRSS
jgi:FkbM family methyltransferase